MTRDPQRHCSNPPPGRAPSDCGAALCAPRGLPPQWTRAEAREAIWATRDAAVAVLRRVKDPVASSGQVHGAARWMVGLGVPHRPAEDEAAALLEAWAGRIARAGLRLGAASARRHGWRVAEG